MIDYAIELGHSVLAITEHETLSNAVKAQQYYRKVKEKNPNFKLILGNEIYLVRNDLTKDNYNKETDRFWHFILLARDLEGHKQLREISTRAWKRSWMQGKMRRVPTYYQDLIDIIDGNKGHVVACSACLGSYPAWLARESKRDELRRWVLQMEKLFGKGNFYLEMQPPAEKGNEQDLYNHALVELSAELDIPYIVSTDSHYTKKEDAPIHKAYLNSQDGEREVDEFYATTYMMSTEEIEGYFAHTNIDLQKAYKNIQTIADSCEDYDLRKPLKIPRLQWKSFHPQSRVEEWYEAIPQLKNFYNSTYEGDRQLALAIVERLEKDSSLQNKEAYDAIEECLDMTWESSIVNKTHWSAYFLNLQNIVECCWEAGSLVGPSRGSGAGFILLYILDIIQINPLRETTKMYPWRFLNPSRVSPLDVDIDIEGGRRSAVLQKLREVYGENRVAGVATFGTEASKASIQTAARGLGMDVDEAQTISSLIPSDRGIARTLKQCYYGDEREGFKPITPFVRAMDNNPELWNVAQRIEGLVCRLGSHAGGIIFVDEPFTESTSMAVTPEGLVVTAYDLHSAEACSLIKYDLLSIEALDKIHNCLDLLLKDGLIEDKGSLKETYESIIGVYKLEREDPEMWKMIHDKKVLSLFQMEEQSGIQGISLSKPTSVDDLAVLNAALRLMAQEKGGEAPLHKFARFKKDINQWYQEMDRYGLTKQEQEILKPVLSVSSGLCVLQESFMRLVQIPECGGFDLEFADRLRKSIAKKNPVEYKKLTEEYFSSIKKKGLSERLCSYVWNILVAMNRGYGFNAAHTLAYSIVALQEMNLAYKFPIIYWNTACLIADSGSEGDSSDYAKIAKSVNKIRNAGINVSLIDINNSQTGFIPDAKNNKILFGLKGLVNVSDDFIETIIANRPYVSMFDFMNRVHPNKQAMIALIKGGAFDQFLPRKEAMVQYIWLTCDKKSRITLQNLPGIIRNNLLPQDTPEKILAKRVYEFNRYLKDVCKFGNGYKVVDSHAIDFLNEIESEYLIDDEGVIDKKEWDKVYQLYMDIFRAWIKDNKEQILEDLNTSIFMSDWQKYAKKGNVSAWEMESLCFYYHDHELKNVKKNKYGLFDFNRLNEEPVVEKVFKKGKTEIPIYKLYNICGTCIAKNKNKSTVYLLTTTGEVVPIKFNKEFFSSYDAQLFRKNPDGTKTVIERSWFNRGNMLIVKGIRRGNEFVCKNYKSSPGHRLYHIDDIDQEGNLTIRSNRLQGEEENEEA